MQYSTMTPILVNPPSETLSLADSMLIFDREDDLWTGLAVYHVPATRDFAKSWHRENNTCPSRKKMEFYFFRNVVWESGELPCGRKVDCAWTRKDSQLL